MKRAGRPTVAAPAGRDGERGCRAGHATSWSAVGGQRGAAAAHTVPAHPLLPAWAIRRHSRELGTPDVVVQDGRAVGVAVKGRDCVLQDGRAVGVAVKGRDCVLDADAVVLALDLWCSSSWRRRPASGAQERPRRGMP